MNKISRKSYILRDGKWIDDGSKLLKSECETWIDKSNKKFEEANETKRDSGFTM
jgi:hypothetical protein